MIHLLNASSWRPPIEAPRHYRRDAEATRWAPQPRTTWISLNPTSFVPKAKSWSEETERKGREMRPVRLAYQPPASSTFLSQQTSHQQSASSTFVSEQISTSHQPPAKRTG
jgi:hypothetical protein